MNKKILSAFIVLMYAAPLLAFAAACGVGKAPGDLTKIADNIKSAMIAIGSVMVVIGFAFAGILYLTSGGGERMNTAKKALIASAIGAILIALASASDIMQTIFCALL